MKASGPYLTAAGTWEVRFREARGMAPADMGEQVHA